VHFQANPFGAIPVEKDSLEGWRRVFRKKLDSVSVWTLKDYGRTVLVIESPDKEELAGFLVLLIGGLRKLTEVAEEPMMNILCSFDDPNWRIIFFPRRKHRPTVYFREGEDRVLISPAAVDMGGLIITPVQGDFERVDATLIEGMFQEVSLPAGQLETVVDAL
jgi:hypothetical protein